MYKNRFEENDKYKLKIDSFRPLDQQIAKQIQEYYKIGLTYSSNALEGNTLDLAETKVVLEDGLTINGKPLKDHLEAIGHGLAFDKLISISKSDFITEENIKDLHSLFYNKIDSDNAGKYRTKPIIVTGADVAFPSPSEITLTGQVSAQVPQLMQLSLITLGIIVLLIYFDEIILTQTLCFV